MANRIFNQHLFRGQGALISFGSIGGAHREKARRTHNDPFDFSEKVASIFLRWQLNPSIGMPSEPFKVWRRPATPLSDETKIQATTLALPPFYRVVQFSEPYVSVTATVRKNATPGTIVVIALSGGVGFENMLNVQTFELQASEQRTFTYQAAHITGLLLLGTNAVRGLRGVPLSRADAIEGWELIETVGLPVDEGAWSDLAGQQHGIKQGLVGAEVEASAAAKQRYQRGVNPFGWFPTFPGGEHAPIWGFPSADEMIHDANADVLPMLHEAMQNIPEKQHEFVRKFSIKPPQNSSGKTLAAEDGEAVITPISLLQLAVSTDPLQSVALGFGTGYRNEDIPAIHFGSGSLFDNPDVSDWDFMVTGLWAKGLDGKSEAVEYGAYMLRPRKVVPAPPAADLELDFLAHHQPDATDLPWKASVRLSWERLPLVNISAVASFVAARYDLAIATPAHPLLESRSSGVGHLPIGNTTDREDPERVRQSATDSAYLIPNDPGSVNALYGIATQNIFGVWSPWISVPFSSNQPAPDLVQIVDANLRPVDSGVGTVCTADLVIEYVLDWRVRSVEKVCFRGRLFAAATRHQPPPAGFPAGLQKTLGPGSDLTEVFYSGDNPSFMGEDIISLDAQGEAEVTAGAAKQGQSRRFRFTIPDFTLDYAGTPHIGLAVQARLTENLAPGLTGAWTPVPKVAYASDPRARPTQVIDIVQLTSLPDASGECHAKISWQSVAGAQGYILYESTETRILTSQSLPEPAPGTSLSDRLTALKTAFTSDPDRNNFTRTYQDILSGTSLDITLPRGSQIIHLYVVIPLSSGGAEGPWPAGPDADESLIAYASPKIAEPAPPTLEVARVQSGAGFAAQLRIGTRGGSGARPRQIDIFRTRVADAARKLDSMGPALMSITSSGAGWTVTEEGVAPDAWIDSARGTDHSEGSWNYAWYRTVAWSEDDPERGVRRGRSLASPAAPVVIPPAGLPPLSGVVASWPGGSIADVQLDFNSVAPILPTPLGPHTMSVEVSAPEGVTLLREALALHEVVDSQPITDSGFWRLPDGVNQNYRVLLRRASVNQTASVTIRLTDPIGRTSEQNLSIVAGPILPAPVLSPIESFSIAGRGKFFLFNIDAPDEAIGGKFYQVRIKLTPLRERPTGPGGVIIGRPIRPGERFRPRPGPIVDIGIARSGSQFKKSGNKLVFLRSLKDIPTSMGAETFSVTRKRLGDRVTITVSARKKISSIEVEVIGPDGQTVSQRARG